MKIKTDYNKAQQENKQLKLKFDIKEVSEQKNFEIAKQTLKEI